MDGATMGVRLGGLARGLVGLPGWMNSNATPFFSAQSASSTEMSSGPLSILSLAGNSRQAIFRSKTRNIIAAGRFVSTSIAKHSRMKSSSTLKVLSL